MSPYLTPSEAAARLGVSRRTVLRLITNEELPALRVNGKLWRVEAHAVDASAPEAVPTRDMGIRDLAGWLRVSRCTCLALLQSGQLTSVRLPLWRKHIIRRRDVLRFLSDNTTGDD
jgi:excisionase family DNA binding protein